MDKRYLLLRKRGWYVRYAIPSKAQHLFGKSEFVVSLKTRSLEEAKIKKLLYLDAFTRAINAHLNFDKNEKNSMDHLVRISKSTLKQHSLLNQEQLLEINPNLEKYRMSVVLEDFLKEQRKILAKYTWERKQKNIYEFIKYTRDIKIC